MKKNWRESSTFQMLFGDKIVPGYIPFFYRLYLLLLKGRRSLAGRRARSQARETLVCETVKNGEAAFGPARGPVINKTSMSREDDFKREDVKRAEAGLISLEHRLAQRGLRFTSAAG